MLFASNVSEKLVTFKAMFFTLTPTCYIGMRGEIRMSLEAFVVVSFGVKMREGKRERIKVESIL